MLRNLFNDFCSATALWYSSSWGLVTIPSVISSTLLCLLVFCWWYKVVSVHDVRNEITSVPRMGSNAGSNPPFWLRIVLFSVWLKFRLLRLLQLVSCISIVVFRRLCLIQCGSLLNWRMQPLWFASASYSKCAENVLCLGDMVFKRRRNSCTCFAVTSIIFGIFFDADWLCPVCVVVDWSRGNRRGP